MSLFYLTTSTFTCGACSYASKTLSLCCHAVPDISVVWRRVPDPRRVPRRHRISSWNAAPTTCGANFASGATAWLAAFPSGAGGSIADTPRNGPLNAAMAALCGP